VLLTEFARDIALLQSVGIRPVIVHGGATQITKALDAMGVYSVFRQGIRVTDGPIMDVVESVLGKINKALVRLINQQSGKAVGLSGQDGSFIRARKRVLPPEGESHEPIDLGQVGEVESIDQEIIRLHHSHNFVPVIMPIGVGADGEPYNLIASAVAGKLAEVLKAEKLIVLTDTPGILDLNGKLITGHTAGELEEMFVNGRLPIALQAKLEAAVEAVEHGVNSAHIIDSAIANALLLEIFTSEGVGSLVRSDAGPHFFADSLRYLKANRSANFDGPQFVFDQNE
jgi:acetylglutamate kinase